MQYSLEDLLHLMKCLRHPENGCSWDLKQTPKEIIKHSIEEIYELVEAVESDSVEEIKSELGDVLFQVVFLSRIFEEDKNLIFRILFILYAVNSLVDIHIFLLMVIYIISQKCLVQI